MSDLDKRLDLTKTVLYHDATFIEIRERHYGGSWIKRGGIGAFMNLARKWDRIENLSEQYGYDIMQHDITAQLLPDIRDLRRYLALVEAEWHRRDNNLGFDDPNKL